MKVKEVNKSLRKLKELARNMNLIKKYFISISDMELRRIEEKYGISEPIKQVNADIELEFNKLIEIYENAIQEAEIEKINISLK